MIRNISVLSDVKYDVVIVGSGIHGAVLALEAARAGHSVALFEKEDFGHCTSANSLKIIHGGIRYLQHADFKRMRESIVSRRSMMQFAPHLVKPLACLMPTYGHGFKGREMMRLAFGFYDIVAFDRNKGLEKTNHLLPGTSLSVDECKLIVPGIKDEGLTGGAVWYDAISSDSERLVLEYVKEAARYGAAVANYTEVLRLQTGNGGVSGVVIRDVHTGEERSIQCRSVVNAAGPWLGALVGDSHALNGQRWAVSANIIVKKQLVKKYAVGLEGHADFIDSDALIKRGKRLFFFVPWQEKYTMIGTTCDPYHGSADSFSLTTGEIEKILVDINTMYPPAALTMEDVTFVHGGLLPVKPADVENPDSVQLDKSSKVIDHGLEGGPRGLLSIKGVKYTTAPDIAGRVVKMLEGILSPVPDRFGTYRAVSPRNVDFGLTVNRLGTEYATIRDYLQKGYGTHWREVFSYLVDDDPVEKNGSLWISEEPPLLFAELHYFLREEMAYTLADVVFRRSNLGSAECPETKTLLCIADIMGEELGWDEKECMAQVELVLQVFSPLQKTV